MKNIKKILIIVILLIIIIYISKKTRESYKNYSKNIAFYTVFCGTNNNVAFKIPPVPSKKYDCYYYTNNKELFQKLSTTEWIPIYLDIIESNDEIISCMDAKHVKILPTEYKELINYDYTVFFDSKLIIINENEIKTLIDKYKYPMLLRRHDFLKPNIWNEFNTSMNQSRYRKEKDKYIKYINKQLANGLSPITQDHYRCGFIIRDMRNPIVKRIDNIWYKNIQECGIQDQISFFFVKQLYQSYIHIIEDTELTIE